MISSELKPFTLQGGLLKTVEANNSVPSGHPWNLLATQSPSLPQCYVSGKDCWGDSPAFVLHCTGSPEVPPGMNYHPCWGELLVILYITLYSCSFNPPKFIVSDQHCWYSYFALLLISCLGQVDTACLPGRMSHNTIILAIPSLSDLLSPKVGWMERRCQTRLSLHNAA